MLPEKVCGLVKRIYPDFSLATFENRLKLQKTIYLLQAFGINLGYEYSWYLRGPYSPHLTKEIFQVPAVADVPITSFTDEDTERLFQQFVSIIEPHKDDADWLEIVASVGFLKKMGKDREEIIDTVTQKAEQFRAQRDRIAEIFDLLSAGEVFPRG